MKRSGLAVVLIPMLSLLGLLIKPFPYFLIKNWCFTGQSVSNALNLSTWKIEVGRPLSSRSVWCRVSCRTARATHTNPVSKKPNNITDLTLLLTLYSAHMLTVPDRVYLKTSVVPLSYLCEGITWDSWEREKWRYIWSCWLHWAFWERTVSVSPSSLWVNGRPAAAQSDQTSKSYGLLRVNPEAHRCSPAECGPVDAFLCVFPIKPFLNAKMTSVTSCQDFPLWRSGIGCWAFINSLKRLYILLYEETFSRNYKMCFRNCCLFVCLFICGRCQELIVWRRMSSC